MRGWGRGERGEAGDAHQASLVAAVAVDLVRGAHVAALAAVRRLVVRADLDLQDVEAASARLEHPVEDLRALRLLVREQEGGRVRRC